MTKFILAFFLLASVASAQTVDFPTKQIGGVFVIDIQFKDGIRHFVVDTGTSTSVFSKDAFADCKAIKQTTVTALEGNAHADLIYVDLEIGGTHIGQRVFRADLNNLSRASGMKIDGLLGQDILSHFKTVLFDYRLKHVIFTN